MDDKKLYIVMYHYVRNLKNSRYPNIKGLDYGLFKEQIKFLSSQFNIVTMESVIEAYEGKGVLPENALLLTFDDGYMDHFNNVFPVLKDYGIQGSFFVCGRTCIEQKLLDVNKIHFILASQNIKYLLPSLLQKLDYYRGREYNYPSNEELFMEHAIGNRFDTKEVVFFKRILQTVLPEELRNYISSEMFREQVGIQENIFASELYMNLDQIKCMKKCGMFIGIHGYDHYWLNKINDEKMRQDIDKSLECMIDIVDIKTWVMNYPYGSYADNVIDYVKEKGCKLGVTTDVSVASMNDNRYKLPRLDTNDFPPKSDNYNNIK